MTWTLRTPVRSWPDAGQDWCLFLDRDGVINRRVVGDYVRKWDQFEFLPGALEALVTLSRWAPHIVVVTNQQGVGKGLMSVVDLEEIHHRLVERVHEAGGRVDGVLACPHLEAEGCECRKPRAGLARDWLSAQPLVDPHRCVVVGDSWSDIAMGREVSQGQGMAVRISAPEPAEDGFGGDADFDSLASFARFVTDHLMIKETA